MWAALRAFAELRAALGVSRVSGISLPPHNASGRAVMHTEALGKVGENDNTSSLETCQLQISLLQLDAFLTRLILPLPLLTHYTGKQGTTSYNVYVSHTWAVAPLPAKLEQISATQHCQHHMHPRPRLYATRSNASWCERVTFLQISWWLQDSPSCSSDMIRRDLICQKFYNNKCGRWITRATPSHSPPPYDVYINIYVYIYKNI